MKVEIELRFDEEESQEGAAMLFAADMPPADNPVDTARIIRFMSSGIYLSILGAALSTLAESGTLIMTIVIDARSPLTYDGAEVFALLREVLEICEGEAAHIL